MKKSIKNLIRLSAFLCSSLFVFSCSDTEPPLPPDQLCGVYSETPPLCTVFGTSAFIGVFKGGANGDAIFNVGDFIDDIAEKKEGSISKRTTWSVDATKGQWAGWYIQNGLSGSPESETMDMSQYQEGKLLFWVKSPVNLEIGIRSGNIPAGTEKSKVLLSNYDSFEPDNEWHHLCIPIADFASREPLLELSRIKIFFVVASNIISGGTNGPQTFWIDDIRWEFRADGMYENCQ